MEKLAEEYPNIRLLPVPGADHRFKRPGELELIVERSVRWFLG